MAQTTQSPQSPETVVPPNARPTVTKRRLRLLLAEDNGPFRDMLVWAFEDDGCDVVAVSSGADLMQVLTFSLLPGNAVRPFDVVVTDVRMPGWTGLHAIESLGGHPEMPPVLVITAFGSDEVKSRARKAGAVAVIDKPFDVAVLCALIRQVTSGDGRSVAPITTNT